MPPRTRRRFCCKRTELHPTDALLPAAAKLVGGALHVFARTIVVIAAVSASTEAVEVYAAEDGNRPSLQKIALNQIDLTDGFWADRVAMCRTRSVPAMWDIMRGTQYKPFLQHFYIAAGEIEGEFHGAQWNDGDFYKFLEACCHLLATGRDAKLEEILDTSIDAIGRAQRADGYIHTPTLIRLRNGDSSARPFENRVDFEMYNMGHLMTAACAHYDAAGSEKFLNIARNAADFLAEAFRNPSPQLARHAVCPSHYMGLVDLYRTTHDPQYLALAQRLFAMRDLVVDGGDDNQDRMPFAQQRTAVGHAVRANYLYAGAADLYLETGDASLWRPLDAMWRNVVSKKIYVTGGCGALYDGASPAGAPNQSQITRVHQAYGQNYQLPNTTAHAETCANIGNVLWNWRMFLAAGEAKYVDMLELSLYNSVLSGVGLDGVEYFYVNPLRHVEPLPAELRWSRTRAPFVTSYCCPPNVLRTIAGAKRCFYAKSDDAVWVNLYGGSRLKTTLDESPLTILQRTNYPWSGDVELTIQAAPSSPFALKLRIPGWAEAAVVRINGEPIEVEARPGDYCELRRRWRSGDVVRLKLPMPVTLLESHPLVEEARNQVAVKRGPIVYCLESPDVPEGVRVHEVHVPEGVEFSPEHDDDLLSGATVLKANLLVVPTGDWDETLYRPIRSSAASQIAVQLIPYYAWANRGRSEMSVWLPRR